MERGLGVEDQGGLKSLRSSVLGAEYILGTDEERLGIPVMMIFSLPQMRQDPFQNTVTYMHSPKRL